LVWSLRARRDGWGASSDRVPAKCRSIKRLRAPAGVATEDEIREAAVQFVRKVSGFREPSNRNREAFDSAVDDVAEASQRLLDAVTRRPA
jgi:hypothetical protein